MDSRFRPAGRSGSRVLVAAVGLAVLFLVSASSALHGVVGDVITAAAGVIRQHPVPGTVLFVLLAAFSAMLAFFSSAVIVPVGIEQWGWPVTALLLWIGWLAGGVTAYGVARFLGRDVVRWAVPAARLRHYQERVSGGASFSAVLLLQAAVPSEIPGYLLGLAGYPFRRYLAALALTELPYAAGAVLLGEGFLRRQFWLMAGLGLSGLALTAWAAARARRSIGQPPAA